MRTKDEKEEGRRRKEKKRRQGGVVSDLFGVGSYGCKFIE
jgi:hypothetical protein